jgi:PQQ-dependent catabolism-associated CXXCW motif protein
MNAGAKRRIDRRRVLLHAFVAVAFAPCAARADDLFDTEGFRRARYRAPVDRAPDPATRIPLDRALAMQGRGIWIDVLPAQVEPHDTIPGALWYPETGRAPVDPARWQALRERVAGHDPVIVFCRADCWMSWNAARRLAREGVPGVLWLAEGIDGWHDAGRALVPAQPS